MRNPAGSTIWSANCSHYPAPRTAQRAFDDYFDLSELLRQVLEDARFEAQASDIRIVANLVDTEHALRGNAKLMRRALENIIRKCDPALEREPAGRRRSRLLSNARGV